MTRFPGVCGLDVFEGRSFVMDGPAPTKGSVMALGGGAVRQSCAFLKQWTAAARWEARKAGIRTLERGGVAVRIVYTVGRPGRRSRFFGVEDPEVVPDVDKVSRAVLDALTGIAYADDRQVTRLIVEKEWAEGSERVTVTVGAWHPLRAEKGGRV